MSIIEIVHSEKSLWFLYQKLVEQIAKLQSDLKINNEIFLILKNDIKISIKHNFVGYFKR